MKKVIAVILIAAGVAAISTFFILNNSSRQNILSPLGQITEKPLEKYSFDRLKNRIPAAGNMEIGNQLKTGGAFSSYLFYFETERKKVSGMLNVPAKPGKHPVLVLLRGFIDQKIYTTGEGTRRDGEIFAQNGFITLAPDFLGYGQSGSPSANPVEERFQTYTTVLDLLSSLPSLNQALIAIKDINVIPDISRAGLWAHSNGGQIALSVLAITGKHYPTVLWAPVSKPFPYSVLYYTDEFDDRGKALRRVVAGFEKDYDSDKYTFTNYMDWINAPIQLNQGTADEEVPEKWSDQLARELKGKGKDVAYITYPGEDHNFSRGSWDLIIQRNIEFYRKYFRPTY